MFSLLTKICDVISKNGEFATFIISLDVLPSSDYPLYRIQMTQEN